MKRKCPEMKTHKVGFSFETSFIVNCGISYSRHNGNGGRFLCLPT